MGLLFLIFFPDLYKTGGYRTYIYSDVIAKEWRR